MASLLGVDVGTKRIGVSAADTVVPLAIPLTTVDVDGSEVEAIQKLVKDRAVDTIVVGYPRNQSGDPTDQTAISEAFADKLKAFATVVFQDESVTSVIAEDRLKAMNKPYTKADIDAYAAMIILQDYLEANYA